MAADIVGSAEESVLVSALTRVIERRMAHSLVVSDGVSERIFYFAIGGIRVIRSGPRKTASVADILVDAGKLTQDDLGRVVAASRKDGQLFGEAVFALGLLQQEDLDEALRTKVQEELLDCFLWDGAELRLAEGQPPKSFYEGRFEAARLTCEVAPFLQSVLARVEEWRSVLGRLPTCREVFESSDLARAEFPEGVRGRLVRELDGSRTAGEAIVRSGMRRVAAYEFLLELLRDSKVRKVVSSAAQKVTRDEVAREIQALEEALKVAMDPSVVRARLARAYETIGEGSRAASEWRSLGDLARRENHLDRALDFYRHAVRVAPTDFATRELILEIHRHKRDYAQLVADGRPLADVFLKHNLLNRAKNLLVQLVGIEPHDTSLRRQLVMVLIGLGERDAALKQLRDLARLLETRKASNSELRDVYVRILALDKNDRHAQDRLETITGVKFQRRMVRLTIASTAAAMILLASWFLYEGSARRDVNNAIDVARRQVEAGEFGAAKATLQKTLDSYSYARATATAFDILEQIERYEQRERERIAAGAELFKTSAQRDEAAAQALVDRAEDLAQSGRTDEAYRTYIELFEVFGDVPLVANVSLPLKLNVLPFDAHVRLAGQEIGQGPMVIKYSPRAKCMLTVERDGYVTFKKVLDGPQEAELDVALEKPTRWTFRTDAAIDAQPLVANGMVYVAGRDRCLTAMSAADGAVQWRTPLGFYSDSAVRPVMTASGVFVATADGDGVCVNPTTGEVLWRTPVGAPVDRQPLAAGADAVIVPANDGSLHGLDAKAGAKSWSLPASAASAAPAALGDDHMAYVDGKGGLVFASLTTGEPLPGYTQPAVLRGSPVAADGRLWVRSEDGTLCIVSATSRRTLRRCPVPAAADFAPAVTADAAYAVAIDGTIHAYLATGELYFRAKIAESPSAAPVVSHGRLYVPGYRGRLYVLDATNGNLLWSFDAKSRITATPVIDAGTIYVPTAGGQLIAVVE